MLVKENCDKDTHSLFGNTKTKIVRDFYNTHIPLNKMLNWIKTATSILFLAVAESAEVIKEQ